MANKSSYYIIGTWRGHVEYTDAVPAETAQNAVNIAREWKPGYNITDVYKMTKSDDWK